MTLSMTRPQKHPDSGYYWFWKRLPDDLRNLVGKREKRLVANVLISLAAAYVLVGCPGPACSSRSAARETQNMN
jgi:hypothetical protein